MPPHLGAKVADLCPRFCLVRRSRRPAVETHSGRGRAHSHDGGRNTAYWPATFSIGRQRRVSGADEQSIIDGPDGCVRRAL